MFGGFSKVLTVRLCNCNKISNLFEGIYTREANKEGSTVFKDRIINMKKVNNNKVNFFLSYSQGEDEVVVQTPEITQRVHHATDEEKLASTGLIGAQTTDTQEEREEQECNKAAMKKQPSSDVPVVDGKFNREKCAEMLLRDESTVS